MKVISTNISVPTTIQLGKEFVQTGMYKRSVNEGIYLTKTGVRNDAVIDRRYHGGEEKACYLFGYNNYGYFQDKFPNANWEIGMFGENITLDYLDESKLIVGSIYGLGETEIMIFEPRQPCAKLNYRLGSNQAVKEFANAPFPGVYVKVLKEGWVRPNDILEHKSSTENTQTITSLYISKLNKSVKKETKNEPKQRVEQSMPVVKQKVIEAAEKYVREELEGEGSGHDWWHIKRVLDLSVTIADQYPKSDLFVIKLGALLHDIGDHKFHNGDHTVGPKLVGDWLNRYAVDEESKEKIIAIVKEISYKGAQVETPMSSLEGEIVQDADRLDAIGAIGIARTFAYGGNKNREMHNPEHRVEAHSDFESYKKTTGPTINHFYEKLLLLKDRMNTSYGLTLAKKRHQYMVTFLEEFFSEWEGKR